MDIIKKLIKNKLVSSKKHWYKRLNSLLGKESSSETDVYNAVWNYHMILLTLQRLNKGDDYDYIERNGKLFYTLPNGNDVKLCNVKDIELTSL